MLAIALSTLLNATAQRVKVLEAHPKKKPSWVNSLEKDYIIVVASSNTLEDAQIKALNKVKEQIISSVAENVTTSSEYLRSDDNGEIGEVYNVATRTRAANIPFIKGISLNQIDQYYWQKVGNRKVEPVYNYHIKYPFTETQLRKLVSEYNSADNKLTQQLNDLIEQVDNAETSADLEQARAELRAIKSQFLETDPRAKQAEVAATRAFNLMRDIKFETVSSELGKVQFKVIVAGKYVGTNKPKVKSNCAQITNLTLNGDVWVLEYNYSGCDENAQNKISVEYRNNCGKLTNDFYFGTKSK